MMVLLHIFFCDCLIKLFRCKLYLDLNETEHVKQNLNWCLTSTGEQLLTEQNVKENMITIWIQVFLTSYLV